MFDVVAAVATLLLLSFGRFALAGVILRPSNVAVVLGDPVTFHCSSDKSSGLYHWTFMPHNESTEINLYSDKFGIDGRSAGHFTVDKTLNNSNNMVISSARFSDAGIYTCKVVSANGNYGVIKKSGQLIILASNPDCGTNLTTPWNSVMEDDFFELWCRVDFRGNWTPPVMDWTRDGETLTDESFLSSVVTDQSVTYTVLQTASLSLHNSSYSCSTSFRTCAGKRCSLSSEIPDYNYIWNSPSINVTYAPTDPLIFPTKKVYSPGERLQCSSSANPPATLHWKEVNSGRSVSGNSFPIKDYMTLEPMSYLECTATNSIGSRSTRIEFSVEKAVAMETGGIPLNVVALTIGGVLTAFFVAIIAMLLVYHIHLKGIVKGTQAERKKSSNENDQSTVYSGSNENYEFISDREIRTESTAISRQHPGTDDAVSRIEDVRDSDVIATDVASITASRYNELTTREPTPPKIYSNLVSETPIALRLGTVTENEEIEEEEEEEEEEEDRVEMDEPGQVAFGHDKKKHHYVNI